MKNYETKKRKAMKQVRSVTLTHKANVKQLSTFLSSIGLMTLFLISSFSSKRPRSRIQNNVMFLKHNFLGRFFVHSANNTSQS